MKKFNLGTALLATVLLVGGTAHGEMVSQEVQENIVTQESDATAASDAAAQNAQDQEEVVIVKKRKATVSKPVVKRRVIVQEIDEQPALRAPVAQSAMQPVAAAAPAAPEAKKSVGSAVDAGIQNKMEDVRGQFEQALVRTLDRIKITVDDGVQPQAAPVQNAVVQDTLVGNYSAPKAAGNDAYMSVDKAPVVEAQNADQTSVAKPEESEKLNGRVRIAPIAGFTSLSSQDYSISNKYTAGVEIEVDIDNNLAATVGYSFSKYDVALNNGNPYYGYYGRYGQTANLNALEYNQNVFDAGLRFYLFPKTSRFRAFIGTGLGYNKGYLNYNQATLNSFSTNPYYLQSGQASDYEVSSFLGQLTAGAEIQLSKMISIGAVFKYNKVLSSSENNLINNNAFANTGYGVPYQSDKQIAGGSIRNNDFTSMLGTVKISF